MMLKTPLFRFTYFDRPSQETKTSADYATLAAIAAMGAIALKSSVVMVDARHIGASGLVLEEKMPAVERAPAAE